MAATIDGLVLCQVGDHRLAFRAHEVIAIDLWAGTGEGAPYARSAYQLPRAPGRLVLAHGAGVVVDSLEVIADAADALVVPPALARAAGGAVAAFVQQKGHLWPVLSLAALAGFLAQLEEARA